MGQAILKSIKNQESSNNDVVIQITRKQLVTFCQIMVLVAMVVLNVLAITINSPFLKELFISQAIIITIFFIKNSKTNQIIR
ncbi:hypothetical protein [Polaribacter aquimarinus]|nr:hypothetical protein [Polaribacter aquimarinus]